MTKNTLRASLQECDAIEERLQRLKTILRLSDQSGLEQVERSLLENLNWSFAALRNRFLNELRQVEQRELTQQKEGKS